MKNNASIERPCSCKNIVSNFGHSPPSPLKNINIYSPMDTRIVAKFPADLVSFDFLLTFDLWFILIFVYIRRFMTDRKQKGTMPVKINLKDIAINKCCQTSVLNLEVDFVLPMSQEEEQLQPLTKILNFSEA